MDTQERERLESLVEELVNKDTITLADVYVVRDCITQLAGDGEAAHSIEDQLHQAVLRAFARGVNDPALAAAALTSLTIEFSRWCA